VVIEPESKTCPWCGGELHAIGEDDVAAWFVASNASNLPWDGDS
jgi:hypothetical protein